MAKRTARAPEVEKENPTVAVDKTTPELLHPATSAMIARGARCNKPLILWRKEPDGSWMECYLQADCTYGGCVRVDPSQVPPDLRG
jgi:hypothetical protein